MYNERTVDFALISLIANFAYELCNALLSI